MGARLLPWLVACLAFSGCQAGLPATGARQADEGGLYVYLQPFPQGAEQIDMGVLAVGALRADGAELALSPALRQVRGQEMGRQRLLAAGALPAGDYAGLALRIAGARAQEIRTTIDFRFVSRRRETVVVALTLGRGQAPAPGVAPAPTFSAHVPGRVAVGLLGFVSNTRSDDVTVFDKRTRQVVAVIATGRGPLGLALDQRARRLYVALSGDDGIEVVDALGGTIADRIRLTPGDEPVDLALSRDGRILLSANRGSNSVSVVDAGSRFEATRIPVGSSPRAVAIDQAGRRAFVVNAVSNSVSVIDLATRVVIRSIPVDPVPVQCHFSRRGDRLYVVHELVPYLTWINPLTLAVGGRFPLRAGMDTIAVDPASDLVYLAGRREPTVGVHEPFNLAPVDFLQAGGAIAGIAIDGEEDFLYLVSPGRNRVLVSHRIRKAIVGEIDVGDGPSRVRLMGEI